MPPVAHVDRQTFLNSLRTSRLLSEEELAAALEKLPSTERGRVLARGLVELGLLTRFQAERLLAGLTEGFILGQYRILDEIGRGGMGRVYKAEHQTMHRVVALKILSPALTKTRRARELFQREVRAAAKLTHPNIVTAFDANQIGDRCYLVMEFVDGPNLSDLVKERGPLPVGQACDYVRQTALGLQYAHDLGMVHRDIKPHNLLVQRNPVRSGGSDFTIKILDFGLARLGEGEPGAAEHSIVTAKQTVMGTPDYLSPEQARSLHDVDSRSDLYSLGCAFYYLLTGSVPFPGGTTLEKLVRHGAEQPKPVQERRPDIPAPVAAIAHRLLAKKPEDRVQTAAELAEVLAPFAADAGNAAWVTIEALPADAKMPGSSDRLPRPEPAGETQDDPWANLGDTDGEIPAGITPVEVGPEPVHADRSGRTPRHAEERGGWMWSLLLPAVVVLVGGGAFAAIYALIRMAH